MKKTAILFGIGMVFLMLACDEKSPDPTPLPGTCVLDTVNYNDYNRVVNHYDASGRITVQEDLYQGAVVTTTHYSYDQGKIVFAEAYNSSQPEKPAYTIQITYANDQWTQQTYAYKNGGKIMYTAQYNDKSEISKVEEYDFAANGDTTQYYRRSYRYQNGNVVEEKYYNYDYTFKVSVDYSTMYAYEITKELRLTESEKTILALAPDLPSPSRNPYTKALTYKEPAHELVSTDTYAYEFNTNGYVIRQTESFINEKGQSIRNSVIIKHYTCN